MSFLDLPVVARAVDVVHDDHAGEDGHDGDVGKSWTIETGVG